MTPMPRFTLRTLFAVVTLIALGLGIVCIAMGWLEGKHPAYPHHVRYVLPTGYTGEFLIAVDPEHGEPLYEEGGVWVFTIPPNGTLRVRSEGPLGGWQDEHTVYVNGTDVTMRMGPGYVSVTNDDGPVWHYSIH